MSCLTRDTKDFRVAKIIKGMRRSEKLFYAMFEKAAIGIVLANAEGKFIETNPALQQMLGYSAAELAQLNFVDITHPEDVNKDLNLFQGLLAGNYNSFQMEKRYIRKDGQIIWVRLVVSMVQGDFDTRTHVVGMVEDITSRKAAEEQLHHLASHDFLTNIPNRYSLEKYLQSVALQAMQGTESALLLIGLDNFKLTNDILGHLAGDEILINFVKLLQRKLRPEDFIARFAGDEFAIVLQNVSIQQARQLAEDLRAAIEKEEICIISNRNCLSLTISVGGIGVDGTLDTQKLLSNADIALHKAKEKGRNRVVMVEAGADSVSDLSRINEIINQIRAGLREDRFVLFFQPVVDGKGYITHHEVLLRLQDEQGQLISPAAFIPLAEQFGLMPQIDRWVVRQSIQYLQCVPDLHLFVNLSGESLGDEQLLRFIEEEIATSKVEASRIGFEITETSAVKDFVRAERWVSRLRELGCAFALDDFGIGFSSFNYLRLLPVDYIKLDGSYVRNIDHDATQLALVQAIHTVAQSLGKKTIAEFVENEKILQVLLELGVQYVQGYYLGKPSPEPQRQLAKVLKLKTTHQDTHNQHQDGTGEDVFSPELPPCS